MNYKTTDTLTLARWRADMHARLNRLQHKLELLQNELTRRHGTREPVSYIDYDHRAKQCTKS